jgi:hypothetical protein
MFPAEQLCSNVAIHDVQSVGEHGIERGVLLPLPPHRHVHVRHGPEADGQDREGLQQPRL